MELKDINCENWLKLRGGKTIFRGENSPLKPLKKPAVHIGYRVYNSDGI